VLTQLLCATAEEVSRGLLSSEEEASKKGELTRPGLALLLVFISIEALRLCGGATPVSLLVLCLASAVSFLIS
jgi:hypothetical protein